MNTYLIPRENRTQQAYYDYCTALPWVFAGDRSLSIDLPLERVTVDGTISGFEQITLPAAPPKPFVVDKTNFLERFTDAELATILTVAKTNVAIEVYVKRLNEAPTVDLTAPRTVSGVQALESYGLIGAGRAAQILAH